MTLPTRRLMLLIPLSVAILLLGASSASAGIQTEGESPPEAETPEPSDEKAGKAGPRDARLKLRVGGLSGGRLEVGDRLRVSGTLAPYAKGEKVTLLLRRGTKTIKRKVVKPKRKPGANYSRFEFAKKQTSPGRYSFEAIHKRSSELAFAQNRTKGYKLRYPDVASGQSNSKVRLFNKYLNRLGYVNDGGSNYDASTGRAVLAYRKVNGLSWTEDATGDIFKKLAEGKGGYKLKHPGSGKHVEADLSRQVMVLARGSRVEEIYHVSSGAAATPTLTGSWRFYRKEAGYNSLEMYYSVYWHRGYATHGYKSVPTYPASHGCLRNPPQYAKHIYDWIDLGDLIHVYR